MSSVRRALVFQLAGLAFFALLVAWLAHRFPVVSYITQAQQRIGAMEFWGGALYPLLYGTCNVLLLPGGIVAIGSGLFFGLWWGFFLNVVGNVGGAAVAFVLSRKLGRDWVQRKFLRHAKWAALDQAIARHGWKIIFLSQLHPLFPSSLLNYLYGVTRIRFGTCMLWIALGQAPGLFLYAYLGTLTQHGLQLLGGRSHPAPLEYVIWLGGLAISLAVTTALARIALRVLKEIEASDLSKVPSPSSAAKRPALPPSEARISQQV